MEDTRLHDGRLETWGKKGVGSVFRLTLPRTEFDSISSSPLPLEPSVTEEIVGLLGDSFPLTGEVPKIGYTPLILDDEDILIEDEISLKPMDPTDGQGESK